jgi:hypothetical protein
VKQLTAPRESAIYFAPAAPIAFGSIPLMDGAMPSPEIWSKSVPTVELDQRSREARSRLECIERLLVPPAGVTHSRIRRLLALNSVGVSDDTSAATRIRAPLSNRQPCRIRTVLKVWRLEALS